MSGPGNGPAGGIGGGSSCWDWLPAWLGREGRGSDFAVGAGRFVGALALLWRHHSRVMRYGHGSLRRDGAEQHLLRFRDTNEPAALPQLHEGLKFHLFCSHAWKGAAQEQMRLVKQLPPLQWISRAVGVVEELILFAPQ